ncbi:hypothetical protein CSV62_08630, partial [Sporosarcina sp. P35]
RRLLEDQGDRRNRQRTSGESAAPPQESVRFCRENPKPYTIFTTTCQEHLISKNQFLWIIYKLVIF